VLSCEMEFYEKAVSHRGLTIYHACAGSLVLPACCVVAVSL
jgi:hypothetical protein